MRSFDVQFYAKVDEMALTIFLFNIMPFSILMVEDEVGALEGEFRMIEEALADSEDTRFADLELIAVRRENAALHVLGREDVDVLITDLRLSNGKDSQDRPEGLAIIAAAKLGTRIIVISGTAKEDLPPEVLARSDIAVLLKPLDRDDLIAILNRHFAPDQLVYAQEPLHAVL